MPALKTLIVDEDDEDTENLKQQLPRISIINEERFLYIAKPFKKCLTYASNMKRNGNFGLAFKLGGNTTHIHDFCIPLDFLGIKELQKNRKRPKFFQRQ